MVVHLLLPNFSMTLPMSVTCPNDLTFRLQRNFINDKMDRTKTDLSSAHLSQVGIRDKTFFATFVPLKMMKLKRLSDWTTYQSREYSLTS